MDKRWIKVNGEQCFPSIKFSCICISRFSPVERLVQRSLACLTPQFSFNILVLVFLLDSHQTVLISYPLVKRIIIKLFKCRFFPFYAHEERTQRGISRWWDVRHVLR